MVERIECRLVPQVNASSTTRPEGRQIEKGYFTSVFKTVLVRQ